MDVPQFTASVIPSTDSTHPVRSVTLTGHGNINKIKVTEAPLPKDVGDDHVEVKVDYCGLSFTDNYLRLGIIRTGKFPVIMGSECSGIVTRVGKDVTNIQVGQKVLCLQMQGGLFRHVVHVHRKYCFVLPDDISVKDAVALGLNFVVAHICLQEVGWIGESDKVFMESVAGGVGTALIQLARTVDDVEVLGTASVSKHGTLRTLGVRRIFNHEDFYKADIYGITQEGVDIVINTTGVREVGRCLAILRPAGRLVLLGSNSTATYPKAASWGINQPKWDSGPLSSASIIRGNYAVAGVNMGVWLDLHPEKVQKSLSEIWRLFSRRKIRPCIHEVLPFDQVVEGIEQLCKRENFGKVILEVKQEEAETQSAETSTCEDPQAEAVAVAVDGAEGRTDPEVQKEATEAPPVEVPASADPQQETVEPKEKAEPDTQKDPASTAEPTVVEPSPHEEPEEKVAEATVVSEP